MKTILSTLNAKYIHTSLALRLLYVANKELCDISFKEYTLKENLEKIADELLDEQADIIGLSVYIWNVNQLEQLVKLLKVKNPRLIIVLGGPEVMYEPSFFLQHWSIDYVVSGEGEFVLGELIRALEKGESTVIAGVSSQTYSNKTIIQADLIRLSQFDSPYQLEQDKEDRIHRLLYFETSRGCPYQCQYCLSSLEKGVRYFPQHYLLENLHYIINNGVKLIKFLDRTFNLNTKHTKTIFDFLIDHHRPNLCCQFEIYADLLPDEMIDYLNLKLPANYFRFEIGIQSTYEPTNIAVKRKQNFPLLAANVQKLMKGGKIDLHLDLIAGLPFETLERFIKSFNDVFELKAKEVQLGFLKMLRGTNLRHNAAKYGYTYNSKAPYEIISNADISVADLSRIHAAEHALEKYWNSAKFSRTMHVLFEQHYKGYYFEFFDALAQFSEQHNLPHYGYQLEDLFRNLHLFLESKNIDLFPLLRSDYYRNFKIRPHGFWKTVLDKTKRKRLLYQIGQDKVFLTAYKLDRKMIEKQAAIDQLSESEYLLTLFLVQDEVVIYREVIYKLEDKGESL